MGKGCFNLLSLKSSANANSNDFHGRKIILSLGPGQPFARGDWLELSGCTPPSIQRSRPFDQMDRLKRNRSALQNVRSNNILSTQNDPTMYCLSLNFFIRHKPDKSVLERVIYEFPFPSIPQNNLFNVSRLLAFSSSPCITCTKWSYS